MTEPLTHAGLACFLIRTPPDWRKAAHRLHDTALHYEARVQLLEKTLSHTEGRLREVEAQKSASDTHAAALEMALQDQIDRAEKAEAERDGG